VNRTGQVVVVTGSTSGIGRAVGRMFADAGHHVIVHGRAETEGREAVAELRETGATIDFHAADLRDPAAPAALVDFAVARGGRLDVLVNNAGANVFAGVLGTDLDSWNHCMDLDLRAAWLASRAAAAVMTPGAAIVNVASNHAFATIPGAFPYNVAKAGLVALTKSCAMELAEYGIRVNAVCPGYVDTPTNDAYFGAFPDPDAERARVEALHPVGRLGAPAEVARAIGFLAAADCAFHTGDVITIDGGRGALLQDPVPGGD